ncbi:MAG: hypothetical protein KF809_08735 [Chloroflexi bacterium]|nr:hypothetical protein [Chloroflexota bacterium]
MAQIFNVTCPGCRGTFPVHPELWQAGYDLLCPFCGRMFPQEESPRIVTGTGEQRPGSAWRGGDAGSTPARPPDPQPDAHAEGM